jgi:DNA-binding LacI/PurR family transcriptional regulator
MVYKGLKQTYVRDELIRSLRNGEFAPGSQLPPEPVLCEKYSVSRSTIRDAVGALVGEGLLVRLHGKGTYVADVATRKKLIALVVHDIYPETDVFSVTYSLGLHLTHYVAKAVRENDAGMMLLIDNDDYNIERQNLQRLIDQNVDGAIVWYIGAEHNIDMLQNISDAGIPLVLVDRAVHTIKAHNVVSDNYAGALTAVHALSTNGCQHICHMKKDSGISSITERQRGYNDAITRFGIIEDATISVSGEPSVTNEQESYMQSLELLKNSSEPFNVFCDTAIILRGFWRALLEVEFDYRLYGIACFDEPCIVFPEDAFVVKIIQPAEKMAQRAVELLFSTPYGNEFEPVNEFEETTLEILGSRQGNESAVNILMYDR